MPEPRDDVYASAEAIGKAYREGVRPKILAEQYNCSQPTIYRALDRAGVKRIAGRQAFPPGTRFRTSGGYILRWAEDYPDFLAPMANWRGKILEHRAEMAVMLGRPLESWEDVHHINGVKDDNRIENLEVWITGRMQPRGVRAEDAVAWAKQILEHYSEEIK